jgi:transposase
MRERTTFVGLDVHQETIAVATARHGGGPAQSLGTIPNRPEAVAALVRKLTSYGPIEVCYEAGPCGYVLWRQLSELGIPCSVVAPSLIPTRVGDKVKTDRRDALKLARLFRSGDLTPVWVPDAAHEALRDVSRAREDARDDQHRARQRLRKFLLRLDRRPPAGVRPWTNRYRAWLDGLRLGQPGQQVVLAEYLRTLDEAAARLARLEAALAEVATRSPHAPLIAALQCLRGVGLITAVTVVAELGDLNRFRSARELMAYAGVVPREHSSGGSQRRGGITKTGNSHLRHVVVEAAWHYRHPPHIGPVLAKRQVGQPAAVVQQAWRAQTRLHGRYRQLIGRGKAPNQAVVAVAREVLGFLWGIGRTVTAPAASVVAA